MTYCDFCNALLENTANPNKHYHDTEYGFAQSDDNVLFERLILEINQAGLSWTTVLNKRAAFQAAYAGFEVAKVAAFDEQDVARLLEDAGIIRNRLKIKAAIFNAQQVLRLQTEFGSLKNWLDAHHPRERSAWVKLFQSRFKFVGNEIVGEFLMSLGYLPGAHEENCPVFHQLMKQNK